MTLADGLLQAFKLLLFTPLPFLFITAVQSSSNPAPLHSSQHLNVLSKYPTSPGRRAEEESGFASVLRKQTRLQACRVESTAKKKPTEGDPGELMAIITALN